MATTLKVDEIVGLAGNQVEIPSGTTITNSGTATGFGSAGQVLQVKQALKIDPEYPRVHYFMALSYYMLKKYKKSIPMLKEAIRLDPTNADAYYTLGLTYLKLDRYQEAIIQWQKALSINPSVTKSDSERVININWLSRYFN